MGFALVFQVGILVAPNHRTLSRLNQANEGNYCSLFAECSGDRQCTDRAPKLTSDSLM